MQVQQSLHRGVKQAQICNVLRQSETPEEKALRNNLIVMQIMKSLKTRDLLGCRVVNRLWHDISSTILQKRDDILVDLRYLKKVGTFVSNRTKVHPLKELNEILKHSIRFPCFNVLIVGTLACPDIQNFLTVFGKNIKKLELNILSNSSTSRSTQQNKSMNETDHLRNLLLYQVPNLKVLSIPKFVKQEVTPKLFPESTTLPNLKSLEMSITMYAVEIPLLKELLDAAPNLQTFTPSVHAEQSFESIITLKKTHLLKKVRLVPTESEVQIVEKLANCQPKLKTIKFDTGLLFIHKNNTSLSRICHSFSSLLESSKESLERITLELPTAFNLLPPDSVFHNVKTLELFPFDRRNTFSTSDVKRLSLNLIFPNLQTVKLQSPQFDIDGTFHEQNFPFHEPLESVKVLEIQSNCSAVWLCKLSTIFPNLIHLSIRSAENFPNLSTHIWSFASLKSLNVELRLNLQNFAPYALDSSLTGFSKKRCKRFLDQAVLQNSQLNVVDKLVNNSRLVRSILNLKELQEFHLEIINANELSLKNLSACCKNMISPLTCIYGFQLMPSVRCVSVGVKPNQSAFILKTKGYSDQLKMLESSLKPLASYNVRILKSK